MPDDDSEGKDKNDPSVEGQDLKKMLKKAKSRDLNFAFIPATGRNEAKLALHLRTPPKKLKTLLLAAGGSSDDEEEDDDGGGGGGKKKKASGSKATWGTMQVDGKVMTLVCAKELPGLKKKMEKMLREEKVKMEVVVRIASTEGGE